MYRELGTVKKQGPVVTGEYALSIDINKLSLDPGNPDWFWFYLSGTGSPG